jgi:methionyl-tRNA formyltransferase
MKVIYMGTPDFAVPALEALAAAGHEIGYVVTQPDAVRDRGKKVKMTPVKEKALEQGIEVLQPERVKGDDEFFATISAYEPDLIAVAAYGQILPKNVLDLPKLGCVNIHGSILPRWRGAAPIQRSIQAGDKETGITIMYMEEGLDTGAMLAKRYTPIEKKTGEQLHDELSVMGAELLVETLPKLEAGEITPEKQDDSLSTYAKMLSKKEGEIDFTKSPVEIERMIRAFDSWPGVYTSYGDKVMKIWKAGVKEGNKGAAPGTVLAVGKEGIEIAAGEGTLVAQIIQMPGKKRVAVSEYLKGNTVEIGTVLG